MSPHAEHFGHKIETIKIYDDCSKHKLEAVSFTICKDSFTKLLRVAVSFALWFSVEGKFTAMEIFNFITLESNEGGQR